MNAIVKSSRRPKNGHAHGSIGRVEALERRTLLAVSTSFVEVPITPAALAADPALANYRSFDLRVTVTPDDRFNVAGFRARLSSGDFYRAPNDAYTTNPATWAVLPNLEFATFVCIENFAAPPLSVLPYVGLPGTPILSANEFVPSWGTYNSGTPGATGYAIARLTVRNDSVGEIYGESYSHTTPTNPTHFVASLPIGARALGLARGRVEVQGPFPPGGITVFDDVNGNGAPDVDEPSSNARDYALVLPAGAHAIRAVAPQGYTVAIPSSGMHNVALTDGQAVIRLDFRIVPVGQASISGRVLLEDPLYGAPTVGMPQTTVFLDHDNNGSIGPLEPSTITDSQGNYSFGQLVAGAYNVREIIHFPYGPAVNQQTVQSVTLATGQQLGGVNFRNRRIDVSVIRGFVRDSGGAALNGWTVYLDYDNDGVLNGIDPFVATAGGGKFEFTVRPGPYVLRQVLQQGYSVESPATGFYSVLASEGTAHERNFVNRFSATTGRIAGNVHRHAPHYTGVGNLGLSNWTVYVDSNNNNQLDSFERRVSTNSTGEYAFDNLAAGFHVVRVSKPSGWRYMSFSTDNHIVSLAAGQTAVGRDFVYTQRVMIAGVVFNDLNGNGVKNNGEHGVTGRRVWVDLNNDGLISAGEPGGYVGAKGMWGFEDLLAGTYTVRVEEITGWQNVGSGAYTVTLASGKVMVGVPFGQTKIVMPATGRSTVPPLPRYIGELSPEVDLTSAWARL